MSNISTELATSIHDYAEQRPALIALNSDEVERVTALVAAAFVREPNCRWWWETLAVPASAHPYDLEIDGLRWVEQLLGTFSGPFTLVITDDQFPPWEAVRGSLDGLVAMVGDHRCFEYFIVDDSLSWILFDTHHNDLVIAGQVLDAVAQAAAPAQRGP